MLQLRETLKWIAENYAEEYERAGYFATITKGMVFAYAVRDKEKGRIVL